MGSRSASASARTTRYSIGASCSVTRFARVLATAIDPENQ
jgi:hypothetical protein